MLIWAVGFFVNKDFLRTLTPFSALSMRFFIAAAGLFIPVLKRHGLRLPKRNGLPVLITCLLNPIAHDTLSMYGLRMTSASHAAVVGGTFPVAACLLAGLARLESITPKRIAGAASEAATSPLSPEEREET
jgi:drug/metabolite transporter (DMT)-like permease